ncbi:MAG: protein-glutamate O-methyltransferase [Myxococcales bacterium]|nr:protein-glutamate O-methyltransferase [Myxococcales bacterium]
MIEDFQFTDADFRRIQLLVREKIGLDLADNKSQMVYGRLARRVRRLQMDSVARYLSYIESGDAEEMTHFVNAVTTNVTQFFREGHHFEHLANEVLPAVWNRNASQRRLRIWSAGCSSGEEPYSIAAILASNSPPTPGWDQRILATDINTEVLDKARSGIYPASDLANIPRDLRQRFFSRGIGKNSGLARVNEELRSLISFQPLNLLGAWPMRGPFDVIFCRNVIIYFDRPTRDALIRRFHSLLRSGGVFYAGHSETLTDLGSMFSCRGQSTYVKLDNEALA